MRLLGVPASVLAAFLMLPGALASQTKPWECIGPEGGPLSLLAQSPSNSSMLFAASTPNWWMSEGEIFRSMDHGATWSHCLGTHVGLWISILVDPLDARQVYVVGHDTLFRSSDGGQTWNRFDLPRTYYLKDFRLSRSDRTTLHAVGTSWDPTKQVSYPVYLRTSEPESTWTARVLDSSGSFDYMCIEIERSHPQNIYICGFSARTGEERLWTSIDGGMDFSVKSTWTVNSVVNVIHADPSNPARLFAATSSAILMSTDSGQSWKKNNGTLPFPTSLCVVEGCVYVATDEGVFRSTDGLSYAFLPGSEYGCGALLGMFGPLTASQMCVEPTTPHTIFLANKAGILQSTDAGQTWSTSNRGLTCGAVRALHYAPSAPNILFAAKHLDALHKSQTAASTAVTWMRLREFYSCDGVSAIAMSAVDPNLIYALDEGG